MTGSPSEVAVLARKGCAPSQSLELAGDCHAGVAIEPGSSSTRGAGRLGRLAALRWLRPETAPALGRQRARIGGSRVNVDDGRHRLDKGLTAQRTGDGLARQIGLAALAEGGDRILCARQALARHPLQISSALRVAAVFGTGHARPLEQ